MSSEFGRTLPKTCATLLNSEKHLKTSTACLLILGTCCMKPVPRLLYPDARCIKPAKHLANPSLRSTTCIARLPNHEARLKTLTVCLLNPGACCMKRVPCILNPDARCRTSARRALNPHSRYIKPVARLLIAKHAAWRLLQSCGSGHTFYDVCCMSSGSRCMLNDFFITHKACGTFSKSRRSAHGPHP